MKPEIFKDKHLVFVTTYAGGSVTEKGHVVYPKTEGIKPAIRLFCNNIAPIIRARPDALMVIIDNGSEADIIDHLKSLTGENIFLHLRPENVGRPRAINEFIGDHLSPANLPHSVWAVDPDVLFDQLSFDLLAEAVVALPQLGLLGMRYKKNNCNPELRTFLRPKSIVGTNGKTYGIVFPLMANVAGPIMAMTGRRLMETLNFKFFPFKKYHFYGHCDAVIYDYFKWRGIRSGYLNGTLAVHLRSGYKVAEELLPYIKSK